MKKIVLTAVLATLLMAGCSNGQDSENSSISTKQDLDSSSISTKQSSKISIELKVYAPNYNMETDMFSLSGITNENSEVSLSFDGTVKTVKSSATGSFEFEDRIPENETTLKISDGTSEEETVIMSLKDAKQYEKAKADKAKADKEKYESETISSSESLEETSTESTETSSIVETTESTTSIKATDQKEVYSVSKDQKELLIAWTQMDCEDYGANLSFRGYDTWKVNVNFVDGKNRWVVTTQDKKYGRVKSIYEWSGDTKDGATLLYLMISGEELVNKLSV